MNISKPVVFTGTAVILAVGGGVGVGAALAHGSAHPTDTVQVVDNPIVDTPTPSVSATPTTVPTSPVATQAATSVTVTTSAPQQAVTTDPVTVVAATPTVTTSPLVIYDDHGNPCPTLIDGTSHASDGHCWTYPNDSPTAHW